MKYDISVIIPVYNNTNEIGLTLNSLLRQDYPLDKFEVIIGDDGSQEDIREYIKKASFEEKMPMQYLRQEDEGFRAGAARNMGIRNAQGRICLFVDSGVLLERNCLQRHFDVHNNGKGNDVVLGYVYGMDKDSDLDEMRKIVDENAVEDAVAVMHNKSMLDGREPLYSEYGDDLSVWPAAWTALWSLHFSASTDFLRKGRWKFLTQKSILR